MKKYQLLKIPKDSSWDRWSIRRYLPIWFNSLCDGIKSIFVWLPTIYKDRNYDGDYIYEILKKKVEFQRKYLIYHNRHTGIERDNFYMTLFLNLTELTQHEFYETEYCDYHTSKFNFTPVEDKPGYSELDIEVLTEKFDEYLKKYPLVVKRLLKEDPELIENKKYFCMKVGMENHQRCKKLMFKVLEENISHWWD